MILITFLGLVMMVTSGDAAGKTYLVETVDGGLPSNPNGAVGQLRSAMNPPLEQGIKAILIITFH